MTGPLALALVACLAVVETADAAPTLTSALTAPLPLAPVHTPVDLWVRGGVGG